MFACNNQKQSLTKRRECGISKRVRESVMRTNLNRVNTLLSSHTSKSVCENRKFSCFLSTYPHTAEHVVCRRWILGRQGCPGRPGSLLTTCSGQPETCSLVSTLCFSCFFLNCLSTPLLSLAFLYLPTRDRLSASFMAPLRLYHLLVLQGLPPARVQRRENSRNLLPAITLHHIPP